MELKDVALMLENKKRVDNVLVLVDPDKTAIYLWEALDKFTRHHEIILSSGKETWLSERFAKRFYTLAYCDPFREKDKYVHECANGKIWSLIRLSKRNCNRRFPE